MRATFVSFLTTLLIALGVGEASHLEQGTIGPNYSVYLHLVARPAWPTYQPSLVFSEVQSIWARYGVRIEWGSRLVTNKPYNFAIQVRADEEAFARESPGHSQAALGAVLFVGGTRPRHIVFVSPSATRRLVEHTVGSSGPEVRRHIYARMLGRAIAHELGHILLVSKVHAARGLMRAHFDRRDVLASQDAFALEPSEIAALATRRDLAPLLARSTDPNAFNRLGPKP